MTLAYHMQLDPYAEWQATNSVEFCERMRATITATACERNRNQTYVDCRCTGCMGLYSQSPLPQQTPLALVWNAEKATATEPYTPSGSASSETQNGTFDALDEIIDDLYANPLPGDELDDVELDLDDEELLKLFPELATGDEENSEINFSRFTEYQTEMPRNPVYRGRCKKCGGNVDNTRERRDDHVFRCLICGWRTSPEYERNRQIHATTGVL